MQIESFEYNWKRYNANGKSYNSNENYTMQMRNLEYKWN